MARQINLLNPALRKTRDWVSATPAAIVAVALLAIVLVAGVGARVIASIRHGEAEQLVASQKQAQEALLAASQQLATHKTDPRLMAELDKTHALVKRQQDIMLKLDGGTIGDTRGFSEYLRGFARQVPAGLWLTGFAIGAGGHDMELRGRMLSPPLLTEYVRRLNAEPAFRGQVFAGLEIQTPATVGAAPTSTTGAPVPPAYKEFVLSTVPPGEQR